MVQLTLLFPELRNAIKEFLRSRNEPLSLNLKNTLAFNTVSVPSANWLLRNGYSPIAAALSGGYPGWSGEVVSYDTALTHSVVWACNRIISESIGFLPKVVMQETSKGKLKAVDHPMYPVMKTGGDDITSQAFSEMLTSHCLLSGNGYAKIIRRNGKSKSAIALQPYTPDQVLPEREKDGKRRLMYTVKEPGRSDQTYFVNPGEPQDIFHLRGLGWNGVRGFDVISYGRNSIGSALATERNLAAFWKKGGRRPFHIEWDRHFLNDEKFKEWADGFNAVAADPEKHIILEDGRKMVADALTYHDAQMIETRQFNVSEVCRWFSLSPHLVQDLSRATYSNIEHLALEFVKTTLNVWLIRWEQNFARCILTPEERQQGFYLKHNLNALLRGEFQTRMAGYATMLQNGIANQDEIRDLEDWNPIDDGRGTGYHIQLNMQTLPEDGGPLLPPKTASQDSSN